MIEQCQEINISFLEILIQIKIKKKTLKINGSYIYYWNEIK